MERNACRHRGAKNSRNDTALASSCPPKAHNVAVLVLPGTSPLDLIIPETVFSDPNGRYVLSYWAFSGARIELQGGAGIEFSSTLADLNDTQTLVVPGGQIDRTSVPAEVARALRLARERGTRIASICTGSFVLAHAGLLDGRRATTHWRYAGEMAERFPRVHVDPNVLYVDEGEFITAAGATAGIDMCLHLVRRDFGEQLADEIARGLVLGPHRIGSTRQIVAPRAGEARRRRLDETYQWLLDNLELDLTVPGMAQHACLSVRAFTRRFCQEKGMSPMAWLNLQRVRAAQKLLEKTDKSIEEVASSCGFSSSLSMRYHFHRVDGLAPSEHRKKYSKIKFASWYKIREEINDYEKV